MTVYHWFAVFVAINLLDAALTLCGLRLGATEVNPLLRALMRRVSPLTALALVKGVYIAAVGVMLDGIASWLPLLTGVFALVCAWNAWQIVKLRRAD